MQAGHILWRIVLALEKLPRALLLALGLAFLAGLILLQALADFDTPLVELHVIPVAFVAWLTRSIWYGVVVAAVAAASGPAEGLFLGGSSNSALSVVTAVLHFAFYLIVLWLLSLVWRDRDLHQEHASTDVKTGVANARGFQNEAAGEIERSRRHGHPLSLLYLDIDDFKAVNDRWGHEEGGRTLHPAFMCISCCACTVKAVTPTEEGPSTP